MTGSVVTTSLRCQSNFGSSLGRSNGLVSSRFWRINATFYPEHFYNSDVLQLDTCNFPTLFITVCSIHAHGMSLVFVDPLYIDHQKLPHLWLEMKRHR